MADLDPETERAVESFVTDWMADASVPGAALAVVDRDGVRYAEGFGARDLDTNEPATPETLFGIGSCSKSFTTLAVMSLVEEGLVAVDDPVSEHVPHYDDAPGGPITVRDLMTHGSGMPSDGMAVALIQRLMGVRPTEVPVSGAADFRRFVQGAVDDRRVPGEGDVAADDLDPEERFFYYNSGYTVLGEVVESVTDQPFAEAVRERVLDPLGMDRTTYSLEAFEADDDRMTPYFPGEDGSEEGGFPFDRNVEAPGGLVAPATELATYVRFWLNGGAVDGTRLLEEATVAEMHTAHTVRQRRLDGSEQGYGYGFMVEEYLGDRLVGHGGSVGVSTAWLGFLEDAGLGVAVVCNTSADPHPMHLGPAVLAILEGQDPAGVEPYYMLDAKLSGLAGEYASYRGLMTAEVERQGGTLTLELGTDLQTETRPLVPESLDPDERRFFTVGVDGARTPVRFEEHAAADGDGVGDGGGSHLDLFIDRWRLHGS